MGCPRDASEGDSHFRWVSLIPQHGYHTLDEERRLAFTRTQQLRLLQVASAQICKCAGDWTSADGCLYLLLPPKALWPECDWLGKPAEIVAFSKRDQLSGSGGRRGGAK